MSKNLPKYEVKSLYEHIERAATLFGEHSIFRFNREGENEVSVLYKEFFELVQKMTLAFNKLNVKDQKVIVMGETSVQWISTYLGVVSAGGVIVPLDPGCLEDEILNFIKLSDAKIVVYSKTFEKLFSERGNELERVEKFVKMDKVTFTLDSEEAYNPDEKYTGFNNILSLGNELYDTEKDTFDFHNQDSEKLSILLFTSGTTGTSKGVMLNQRNICAVMKDIHPVLTPICTEDRLLCVLPIHHTYEMSAGILAPMIYGAEMCISDGIKYVSKNLKQFKPTVMALVPLFVQTFYKTILKNVKKMGMEGKFNFGRKVVKILPFLKKKLFARVLEAFGGCIKYLIVGGAALNPEIVDFFRTLGIQVSQGYGITECAPLISVVPLDVYNPTSCGKVMPGLQIRIDKENPDDSYGEIVVKGENVMLGYYNAPELTAEVLSEDGWFRTGDYGYVDKKNYIYITGRKKNIIIASNGKNVFPEEIEEYISEIPYVGEVVVVGREDKEKGEVKITAIVVPNMEECEAAGFNDDEVIYEAINSEITKINKKLVVYKHIDAVELRKEPFEKTAARKIKRFLVK